MKSSETVKTKALGPCPVADAGQRGNDVNSLLRVLCATGGDLWTKIRQKVDFA
jgi:hypothetical protein